MHQNWTSSQDGGIGKHPLLPCTTTEKIIARPQNKYHQELSENQVVWKSNKQRFKEATFIQTGRRVGDLEMGREERRGGVEWRGSRMSGPTFMYGG